MKETELKKFLAEGNAFLGIELGSTRIKSILIGADCKPLASGSYDWESRYENGIWTYPLADVWAGIQSSYEKLLDSVQKQYGVQVTSFRAIGISAMMHGYLPFNARGEQLVPFRTWCNTMTEDAAAALSELFQFNIPQRWSIAHLYHAILQGESHINEVAFLTTLSGYIHWQLTGKKVLGVGDASGMFPIDSSRCDFNARMIEQFDQKMAEKNIPWNLKAILPHVLSAGEPAGTLTAAGAKLLDPSGALQAGIPLCPPEGDAGTGMVATNSVAERTGNVSAGTSIFAMVVLEKMLQSVYTEVDLVTTPSGRPVAMVHCNNCTSDLNAWAGVLQGFADALGVKCSIPQVLDTLFFSALQGEPDCGGLLSYNYSSGEPITRLDAGRPLFVRRPDS
ncbi:MAG: FGGY family carbohydrate kinase, partial [Pygmaiobacter sp.]